MKFVKKQTDVSKLVWYKEYLFYINAKTLKQFYDKDMEELNNNQI